MIFGYFRVTHDLLLAFLPAPDSSLFFSGRDAGQPRGVQPHPQPSGRQSGREDQEAQDQQHLALDPHQPLGRQHPQPNLVGGLEYYFCI